MATKREERNNEDQPPGGLGPQPAEQLAVGGEEVKVFKLSPAAEERRAAFQPVKEEAHPKTLCVVMPALNEEVTIKNLIHRIPRNIPGIAQVIVILVDDGSIDRTPQLAREAGAIVITHTKTRGVGLAFQAGLKKTLELGADYMVNIDADGQFNPEDIPKLIAPLIEGDAEFVTASRFVDKSYTPKMNPIKLLGNKFMSALISMLAQRKLYDVSCGFRAYTRKTLQQINLFGHFTYTQETILDLSFKDVPLLEIPVHIRGKREHGRSRVASNLFRYAYSTSKIIFRSFRDYRPMHVFGLLAAAMFVVASGLSIFLLHHYYVMRAFFPHRWAGFAAASLFGLGFLVLVTGLIGDMLARIRINQERILYLLRKRDE